jgi:acylphosphatase
VDLVTKAWSPRRSAASAR